MEDALERLGLTPVIAGLLLVVALIALLLVVLLRRPTRHVERGARRAAGVDARIELRCAHAQERMQQRRISADEVTAVLRTPDRCQPDPGQSSMRFEKDLGGRTVKVWVAADPWPPVGQAVIKTTAAQYARTIRIRRDQAGQVIGRGGATVRQLQGSTRARISVERDGRVRIQAGEAEHVAAAVREVVRVARSR